jgi:hypothetical protein
MAKQSVKELGRTIPERLRLLSSLIARKPSQYTPEWASSIEQAFSLYTNTNTVNLVNCLNDALMERDWPLPAYIDLKIELRLAISNFGASLKGLLGLPKMLWTGFSLSWLVLGTSLLYHNDPHKAEKALSRIMIYFFKKHSKEVFKYWENSPLFKEKLQIIGDIKNTFRRKYWASCITTTLTLLDYLMREIFETEKLNVTIQVLRDAFFKEAKLESKDLKPGSAVWDGARNPEKGNTFAKSLEEDLRLPGVYLASFFEFANRYYEWYKSSNETVGSPLNRHAIIHCSSEYWSEENAVRILSFLDLTLRLEPFLKLLIHGKNANSDMERQGLRT